MGRPSKERESSSWAHANRITATADDVDAATRASLLPPAFRPRVRIGSSTVIPSPLAASKNPDGSSHIALASSKKKSRPLDASRRLAGLIPFAQCTCSPLLLPCPAKRVRSARGLALSSQLRPARLLTPSFPLFLRISSSSCVLQFKVTVIRVPAANLLRNPLASAPTAAARPSLSAAHLDPLCLSHPNRSLLLYSCCLSVAPVQVA